LFNYSTEKKALLLLFIFFDKIDPQNLSSYSSEMSFTYEEELIQNPKYAFIVTFTLLAISTGIIFTLDCCLQMCLERHRKRLHEREQQNHAAVLQMATRRKLANRVIVSPRRTRGRSRALEFDMTSSDEEVILKPEGADTMPKMRTRSSSAKYHSE